MLTDDLGFTAADANLGFEGVAYVPDSFLTRAGFRTDGGVLYDPASYPDKALADCSSPPSRRPDTCARTH